MTVISKYNTFNILIKIEKSYKLFELELYWVITIFRCSQSVLYPIQCVQLQIRPLVELNISKEV